MGIHGLWPILETTAEKVALEKLEGKRVAVDVSIWLYQAQLGFSPDSPSPHVHLLIRRLAKLIFYKIRPVFVFDGPAVPVFKHRVLEERAMRRHADEIGMSKEKMRHLEDLAKSEQEPAAVQKALNALRSPQKGKRREEEERMFELPTTSREVINLVESSEGEYEDDEEDDEEVKEEGTSTSSLLQLEDESIVDDLMGLTARRETIRAQRLLPHQVPRDSESFSSFQLQRLLGRSRLNERIEELKKCHEGERVVMLSREGRKREHRIEWDDADEECRVIEHKKTEPRRVFEEGRMALSLDYMSEKKEEVTRKRDEEEDIQRAISLSLADQGVIPARGEWMSKSGLLEEMQRKRHGMGRRVSSSSSSVDDSEMIDVPSIRDDDVTVEAGPSTSEWAGPALEGEEAGGGAPSMMTSLQNDEGDKERLGGAAYRELQEVLSACGFPWIEAPGEAEAQCVWLQREGLVDAVVSDDSDCFAFGVGRLVRHMFSREKDIEYYEGEKVERELGVTRWDTISIAMLSGGDYSKGIKGVGVVTALEMMAQFTEERKGDEREETLSRLGRIEEWLLREKGVVESAERRKIRAAVERTAHREEIRGLASSSIVAAYSFPLVDESREALRWRQVRIERLKGLLWQKLKWNEERVEKTILDAFTRWNEFMARQSSYQMHISSFIVREGAMERRRQLGKRVEAALAMIREKREALPSHLMANPVEGKDEKNEEEKRKGVRMSGGRKRTEKKVLRGTSTRGGRGRGRGRGASRGGIGGMKEVEELKLSSSSSSDES